MRLQLLRGDADAGLGHPAAVMAMELLLGKSGKVEAVSALAETALLFLLSGIVIWEAIKRLTQHEGHVVEATIWAFGVILVSIVVDFFRARALMHTAARTSSHALVSHGHQDDLVATRLSVALSLFRLI